MEKFDAIIIGAGGAGLMTARELGKLKYNVLILDKKKDILDFSFNTLGSFIDLKKFSLSENVVAQKINSVIIYSKLFKRKLNCKAYILDKKELHKEILESLDKKHVILKSGVKINNYELDDEGNIKSICDSNLNTYSAKIFIDCSGNDGILTKKLNLQENKFKLATGVEYNVEYLGEQSEAHLFMGKDFQGGYAWIFPLKNKRAIVGFGSFDNKITKNLKKNLDHILTLSTFVKLVKKDTTKCEGGSIPLTEVKTQFVFKNVIAVGDSVTQVNPIVGEGYKFIFESSFLACEAIDLALKNDNLELLNFYNTNWNKRFTENYQFAKYAQNKIFKYSKIPFLVDFILFFLKSKKDEKLIQVLAGEYNRKSKQN